MKIDIADVVISLNGRDKGKRFIVYSKEDNYYYLIDGKGRKLEKPKKKKDKHIKPEGIISDNMAQKLINGDKITNKEVRRVLAEYAAISEKEDM
jgi:ribosomal protein L14E/L6E/L27E